jgi:hypothetical protein
MSSSKEAAILAAISFIAVILIYSSVARFDAFARSKIESGGCTSRDPTKPGATSAKECCWGVTVTDDKSGRITDVYSLCQTCEYDSNGNKIDCRDTSTLRNTGTFRPPPSAGAAAEQPPSSSTCPNGLAPDANGKCPITTAENPPQNLASNNPQQGHHNKGSNLLEGQESTKKGNSSSVP